MRVVSVYQALAENLANNFLADGEQGIDGALRTNMESLRQVLEDENLITATGAADQEMRRIDGGKRAKRVSLAALIGEQIKPFVLNNALKSTALITDTDRNEAAAIIAAGDEEGASIPQIAKRLELAFAGTLAASRAGVIAATETAIATSKAQDQGARNTGVILTKTWIAVDDGQTRGQHNHVDDTTVNMDEKFEVFTREIRTNAGRVADTSSPKDLMSHPHDITASGANIIRCRCALLYNPE